MRRSLRFVRPAVGAALFSLSAFVATDAAVAQSSAPIGTQSAPIGSQVVEEIVIQGAQRVEPGTVRSYLLIQPGDEFKSKEIDKSLKSLFATGLFSDVTLRREGDRLVVNVVENPIINRIAFEGNREIDDSALEAELSLRPRVIFTRSKVQNDVQRLLTLYRRSGRFAATIEPKIIQLPQNRVDLAFEISEGDPTNVSRIRFIGNEVFEENDLKDVLQTVEASLFRPFSTDDTYDPDRLTLDRELLRQHYLANGFADFRVNSAVAELSPDREDFFITFSIDEGRRYKVNKVDIKTTLKRLNTANLREAIRIEPGQFYDASQIDRAVERITDRVGDLGFAFVEIRPRLKRNRKNRTLDLLFEINQGPRVFVERIDIVGNTRTQDKVVRREFRLVEGDAFNAAKLRRSRQRIQNLGFFENANVEQLPGSGPDQTVLRVTVKEQPTGDVSFGAGFSTENGILGDFSINERNFLGQGQNLGLRLLIAGRRSEIDLAFTEPFFLDRDIRATFNLFRETEDLQDFSSFDQEETGGRIQFSFPVTENIRQSFQYRLLISEIEDVGSAASEIIAAELGDNTISEVSHDLTFDFRDSSIRPRNGYRVIVSNDFGGVGGSARYLRNNIRAAKFFPVGEESVLIVRGRAGHIFGINDDVILQERFFVGGRDLRGFESGGVGARDVVADDALGVQIALTGSVQLEFPLPFGEELGLGGRLFTDFGSASGLDPDSAAVADSAGLRLSVGGGITVNSPLGPVAVDLGFPLLEEDFDETEVFRVDLGSRF